MCDGGGDLWIKEGLRSASCVLHLGGIFGLNYRILWMMVVMPQPTSTVCYRGYYCTYMSKDKILRFQKSKKRKATYTLRTIGAVVHGGSTIFCSGSPTGVRDVQRHLVFPVEFYILNGQIGHKKGISAKHWYVASFEIVQIH